MTKFRREDVGAPQGEFTPYRQRWAYGIASLSGLALGAGIAVGAVVRRWRSRG